MFCKVKSLNEDRIVDLLKAGALYFNAKYRRRVYKSPFLYREHKLDLGDGIFSFSINEPNDTIERIKRELKKGNVYIKVGDE